MSVPTTVLILSHDLELPVYIDNTSDFVPINRAPWGPGIVSKEEFARVKGHKTSEGKGLRISTKVNGKQMQEGGTEDMIFDVRETVAFLSQGTTLMPGDLIWTGT